MDQDKPRIFGIARLVSILMVLGGIAAVISAKGIFQEASGLMLSSLGFLTFVLATAAGHVVERLGRILEELKISNRDRRLLSER
ncbi:hypothetical protein [Pseudoroseomonas cervicalis]|uniref:hypothetical protein n=1 Tax=Teichococcus cervicalis TaxID=204525 RepID=UPI0022F1DAB6|nr:hypothetical protein [Pseudoroseomonas cervicalis]WBV44430.1 hypothetical protein PFY06_07675 [Pseudoroseomonas cervicalis]